MEISDMILGLTCGALGAVSLYKLHKVVTKDDFDFSDELSDLIEKDSSLCKPYDEPSNMFSEKVLEYQTKLSYIDTIIPMACHEYDSFEDYFKSRDFDDGFREYIMNIDGLQDDLQRRFSNFKQVNNSHVPEKPLTIDQIVKNEPTLYPSQRDHGEFNDDIRHLAMDMNIAHYKTDDSMAYVQHSGNFRAEFVEYFKHNKALQCEFNELMSKFIELTTPPAEMSEEQKDKFEFEGANKVKMIIVERFMPEILHYYK